MTFIYVPVAFDLHRIKANGIIIEMDLLEKVISSVVVVSTDIASITK